MAELETDIAKLSLQEEGIVNENVEDLMVQVLFYPKLLDHVFKHLELKDLLVAQEVCTTWHDVSKLSLQRRLSLKASKRKPGHDPSRGPSMKFTYNFKMFEHEKEADDEPSAQVHSDNESASEDEFEDMEVSPSELEYEEIAVPEHVNIEEVLFEFKCLPPARQKYRPGPSAQWQTLLESQRWILTLQGVSIENVLTVQEWNAVWPVVLRDFKDLKYLNLVLRWYPEEKPLKQVELTPDEADPNESIRSVRATIVLDSGSAVSEVHGIDATFYEMCSEASNILLKLVEAKEDSNSTRDLFLLECYASHDPNRFKAWEVVIVGPGGLKSKVNPNVFSALTCAVQDILATLKMEAMSFIRDWSMIPYFPYGTPAVDDVTKVRLVNYDFANLNFEDIQHFAKLPKLKDVSPVIARQDINQAPNKLLPLSGQWEAVRRLDLSMSNFGAAELEEVSSALYGMMPNIALLMLRCHRITQDPEMAENEGLKQPVLDAGIHYQLLTKLPKLKKLKHFIWQWYLRDSFDKDHLSKISEALGQCQALETVTVRFGNHTEAFKDRMQAVVDGCSKAPKVRALWVYLNPCRQMAELQRPGVYPDFVRVAEAHLDFTMGHHEDEYRILEQQRIEPRT